MALETLTSNELLNFIILETLSATQFISNDVSSENKILLDNNIVPKQQSQQAIHEALNNPFQLPIGGDNQIGTDIGKKEKHLGVQGGKKKRRRRQKVCKNKEKAENQRMTHIAVERNRRKQMNEHLAVLRSLMPESYAQRGDQASIVGGAIEFVKRLEHTLQSLESQKFQLLQQGIITTTVAGAGAMSNVTDITTPPPNSTTTMPENTPFAQFLSYPKYTCSQSPQKLFTSKRKCAIADIEVTLIETHANVRILSQRRFRQLSKLVASFQTLYLTTLHLTVTTLDPLVLYSISAKVEEGCQFSSADDIASAINHILRIIEEEATLCC